jgi:Uma2 family endonuclease
MVAASQQPNPLRMTEAEYLEFERSSESKHEFINGEMFPMAGATWEHNRIFSAIFVALSAQLRGKQCRVNPSDQRIKVTATRLYLYADISVVCGEPKFADKEFDSLINPIVIVEILSKSSEAYDRGEKFQYYRQIATLQEYLLISQAKPSIEGYARQKNGKWELGEAVGLEATFELASIDCTLPLTEVYEDVFPKQDGSQSELSS